MSWMGAVARVSAILVGTAVMAYGALLTLGLSDVGPVLVWFVGGVLVHDLVLAPLVLGAGWLLRRARAPRSARVAVQTFVVVAGTTLLASAPTLLARPHVNVESGLLEQDYRVGLVAVLVVAALSAVVSVVLTRRRARDGRELETERSTADVGPRGGGG